MGEFTTLWLFELKDLVSGPMDKIQAATGISAEQMKKLREITTTATDKLDAQAKSTKILSDSFESVTGKLAKFGLAMQGLSDIKEAVNSFTEPGMQMELSVNRLGLRAGATKGQIDELGKAAREAATTFGGEAAEHVAVFDAVLNRLGSNMIKTPDALKLASESADKMALAMGGSAVEGANMLSSAVVQFNLKGKDAIGTANNMAKVAEAVYGAYKDGGASFAELADAFQKVGINASRAGLNIYETLAAVKLLHGANIDSATAGMGLNQFLGKIEAGKFSKDEESLMIQDKISPKALLAAKSFGEQLEILKPAVNDLTLMGDLFGLKQEKIGQVLINNTADFKNFTSAIAQSNDLQAAAAQIGGTTAMTIEKMEQNINNAKLALFGFTGAWGGYVSVAVGAGAQFGMLAIGLKTMIELTGNLYTGITTKLIPALFGKRMAEIADTTAIGEEIAATEALNIVSGNLFLAITGGLAVAGLGIYAATRKTDDFGDASKSAWEIANNGATEFTDTLDKGIGKLTALQDKLKNFYGDFQKISAAIDKTNEVERVDNLLKIGKPVVPVYSYGGDKLAKGTNPNKINWHIPGSNDANALLENQLQRGQGGSGSAGSNSANNESKARIIKVTINKLVGFEGGIHTNITDGLKNVENEVKRILVNAINDTELTVANQ